MDEVFDAAAYLPPQISDDGKTVTISVVDKAGSALAFSLPSPVNAQLIADLQNADAEAKDRFLGIEGEKEGGATVRRTVRQPKTVTPIVEGLTESFFLVFDDRLPTEMTFQMPPGAEWHLAQALLPLLREKRPTPTKQ